MTATGAAAAFGAVPLSLPLPEAAASAAPGEPVSPSLSPYLRVRGMVRVEGKGLARVAISDGINVVATDQEGRFELMTPRDSLIRCSVPGDHEMLTDAKGLARMYQPIPADAKDGALLIFELKRRTMPAGRHMFYVLADPQTQTAAEMKRFQSETVPDVKATIAEHAGIPAFGAGCGDLLFDDLSMAPGYEQAVADIGIPFVQVKGNHDLDQLGRSNEAATAPFVTRYGPSYYSFNVGAIHYIVLDDVMWYGTGFIGYVDERQLHWLQQDLAQIERGRTVVLFQHIPMISTQYRRRNERAPGLGSGITNRMALYRLLQPYKTHIMSAHTHENENVLENGVFDHVHGAVCGAWWTSGIGQDGSPNGYGVYEVDGESLKWHYKATGKPSTYQLRVYGPGADSKSPNAVIANVWNWDPEWKVTWIEDGRARGLMEQFTANDPMAAKLMTGPALPQGRGWIEPAPAAHMFRCTPSATAREVRVEVVDRFGGQYSEVWTR